MAKKDDGSENTASKLDWRLAWPAVFYVSFMMIGASLSGVE